MKYFRVTYRNEGKTERTYPLAENRVEKAVEMLLAAGATNLRKKETFERHLTEQETN